MEHFLINVGYHIPFVLIVLIFLINCNDTLKFFHYFISPYGDSAMLASHHTVSRNNCQSLKTALIDTTM